MTPIVLSPSHQMAMNSLRFARGRYSADRAAQLSGIPKSTIYDWNRNDIYEADYAVTSTLAWSYRDLVFLRILARLRAESMPRPKAAAIIVALKAHIDGGNDVSTVMFNSASFVPDGDTSAPLGGLPILFAERSHMGEFDLTSIAVAEIQEDRLWGPDLVNPNPSTHISPWVMGGDPCIVETRIPTSSIFALKEDRGLNDADVVDLYPGLTEIQVRDAHHLEWRMRGAGQQQVA